MELTVEREKGRGGMDQTLLLWVLQHSHMPCHVVVMHENQHSVAGLYDQLARKQFLFTDLCQDVYVHMYILCGSSQNCISGSSNFVV